MLVDIHGIEVVVFIEILVIQIMLLQLVTTAWVNAVWWKCNWWVVIYNSWNSWVVASTTTSNWNWSTSTYANADTYCSNLSLNWQTDWIIPNTTQAWYLYTNKGVVWNVESWYIWTSSITWYTTVVTSYQLPNYSIKEIMVNWWTSSSISSSSYYWRCVRPF